MKSIAKIFLLLTILPYTNSVYAFSDKCDDKIKHQLVAAKNGSLIDQYTLGYEYYKGICVTKNLEESAKWFEMLANRGSKDAMYWLFLVYGKVDHSTWNEKKGKYWLLKAGKAGSIRAYRVLRDVYKHGSLGFPKDEKKYKYWDKMWQENKHLLYK